MGGHMSDLQIAGLYVGLNLLIILVLAGIVVSHRRRSQVSLGHGDDERLLQATRSHGNATEYLPMALIALVVMALIETPHWGLHLAGGTLTIARILHGTGLLTKPGRTFGRFTGTLLTWLVYIGCALWLILQALLPSGF